LLVYLFSHIASIGIPNAIVYGAFIFLTVYSYTELMDRNPAAPIFEVVKSAVGLFLIAYNGWFGINRVLDGATYLIGGYLILSVVMAFVLAPKRQPHSSAVSSSPVEG
jgi:alkylglycerol monooxygenase